MGKNSGIWKKTQGFGKKLNVPEENAYPILQKSVKKKPVIGGQEGGQNGKTTPVCENGTF